ncbi:MAG TPA: 3-oxoadipate enol-lactonase [Baekduia sp.]|jgi:3-oxoadipate enol-lactonase
MTTCALSHEDGGPPGAPPLVLAASLGTTRAMWDPQIAALRERFRTVRYDQRGHGASPAPPGPYAIADLGRDALALLDRLGLERTSWAGVSLGGMVGMWLAIHAPQRIDRLVLLCTSAHLGPQQAWTDRAAAVRAAGTVDAVADAVVARWLTPAFADAHPDVRAWLRTMLAATPPEGYAACCEAIRDMDQRAELGAITAPTLVISGVEDLAAPAAHQQLIAEAIPGARLVALSPAAHLAGVERADDVTALIADHLDREQAA